MTLDEIELVLKYQPAPCLVIKPDQPGFPVIAENQAFRQEINVCGLHVAGQGMLSVINSYFYLNKKTVAHVKEALNTVLGTKSAYTIERLCKKTDIGNIHQSCWHIEFYPVLDKEGQVIYLIQNFKSIDHKTELLNQLEKLEKHVLEINSERNIALDDVLADYINGIEHIFPDMTCSVMKVKNNKLYNWITSSLPLSYTNAIEGLPVGVDYGSCGTAAHLKKPVIVSNIANSTHWINYKQLAIGSNLRACWSYPVTNNNDEVIATFGIYYHEVKHPGEDELKIIERAAALLKVILENRYYAETLKETMLLMSQGQELASFGNWSWDVVQNKVSWSDTLYSIYGLNKYNFKATFEGYQELLHPDDRAEVIKHIQGVLNTKKEVEFEERIIRPGGEIRYLRSWGTLKCDSEGNPLKMIGACLDITESKKIQQDLVALKDKYSDLFQLSPHPMFVYDINTLQYLDVNDAAINIYGYTKQEFLSMTLHDIRPPEDMPNFEKMLREEIKTGVPHTGISKHIKASGEIINVLTRGNSITYEGREARIVIAMDYTDKFRAEEALKESEHRFRALIQEGSDLICITDNAGNYKYVSPNAGFVTGIEAEALLGQNIADHTHADDFELVKKGFSRLNEHSPVELPPIRFNDRWIQTIITDLRDDPAIAGIVLNSRNVTQQVMQDIAIKDHLERYNAVSKATSDAIWDLNIMSGKIVWNHGIKGIFGYRELQNNYQWWFEQVHPDDIDQVTAIINRSIEQKTPRWMSEYRFRCADGSYKFVLDRGFLIFNDDGQPVRMIGAMQDITERVNYIKAIEKRNTRLQEIAWTQSHLVRAPLARILGLLELMSIDKTGTDKTEMLEYLNISAKELDEVIHDIIKKSQAHTLVS